MIELLVVVAIIVVVGGMTLPSLVQTWYDIQLRSSAAEVADLMQRARMQAARANISPGIPIRYQVTGGMQQAYADFNNNGAWDQGGLNPEPGVNLPRITAAAAAPNGGNGVPPAFVDTMDTTAGVPCDNTCTLAFSPRGLPCNLVGAVCITPAASYFVYYFQDNRPNGWSAVLVSKAGRTKTLVWNGTTWR
jgi:Tfp pilus assembly protein FimT